MLAVLDAGAKVVLGTDGAASFGLSHLLIFLLICTRFAAFNLSQIRALLDAGVNVGLGTDGAASAGCSHLLNEARMACFLQRAAGDVAGEAKNSIRKSEV